MEITAGQYGFLWNFREKRWEWKVIGYGGVYFYQEDGIICMAEK